MLEVKFYIEIAGNKVEINEPFEFTKVEFVAKQNKDFFGRNKMVAGEKSPLTFTSAHNYDVFQQLIDQHENNGFNAGVYFYFNDLKLRLDFETARTDGITFIELQAIEGSLIADLDYNKSIKIDLNSALNVKGGISQKARSLRTFVSSTGIARRSNWKNKENVEVGRATNRSLLLINTLSQINEYDIKDTYTPPQDFLRRDWDSWWARKTYQFISFKDNYKNVEIKIKVKGTYRITGQRLLENARLTLFIGREDLDNQEWYDSCIKHTVSEVSRDSGTYNLDLDRTYNLPDIQRGYGVWLCWENHIQDGSTSTTGCYFNDTGCEMNITGTSFSFGSIIESIRYKDAIENVLLKIAGRNITLDFTDQSFNDFFFTGNQVRFGIGEKCIVTWEDIQNQLKERGLGYEVIGDIVRVRNFEYFNNNTKSVSFNLGIDDSKTEIEEDSDKNINTLIYKYKKYQALKEIPMEGNAGTVNGESEWYINNRFTDKSMTIDLPIARDKFLLENTRSESLAYNKNTKTSDDDTMYLFTGTTGNYVVNDIAIIVSRFNEESQIQDFALVDQNVGWEKLGLTLNAIIKFNIEGVWVEYIVNGINGGSISCIRIGHTYILNETIGMNFSFSSESEYLIDLKTSNINRTIKQNLLSMRGLLNNYNFYNTSLIINKIYKENGNFEVNGVKEIDPITKFSSVIKPKIIHATLMDDYGKLDEFLLNKNGFVSLQLPNGKELNIYIIELSQKMNVSKCGITEYTITGQLKNEHDRIFEV